MVRAVFEDGSIGTLTLLRGMHILTLKHDMKKKKTSEPYLKYVHEFPNAGTWYKWIKYEMENNRDDVNTVRAVFESAVDTLLSNKLEETTTTKNLLP